MKKSTRRKFKKVVEKIVEQKLNERKFDLNYGHMGNGITVWDRNSEKNGDYETIAHIDRNRKITYRIDNPPREVVKFVEKIAKGKNPSVSVSQPDQKVFKESKLKKVIEKIVEQKLNEAKEDYKVGDTVLVRNVKTKRNKKYKLSKKLSPVKWEADGGKIIYFDDIVKKIAESHEKGDFRFN